MKKSGSTERWDLWLKVLSDCIAGEPIFEALLGQATMLGALAELYGSL
jgi:hypothetical protein